jgi:DNA polymerase III subunit gamma/tau
MSYTVLARKWRPQQFEDVVGQTHVSRSLMNALRMGRVAHAFLFSGTRGVGKTTTARILAKALNCEKGPTPSPCCECISCKEITQGNSVDVIEIDAASNTSVENIRDLNENVKYAPARSRYKVYIIDEVHMLSTSAFNALLKTLEEPPSHVVFIFATTDAHKLPATILSRCQHYDFRRVSKDGIKAHLKSLCDKEGIKAEDAALARLASIAEGSVRDSLSLLDQVVSYCGADGIREEDLDDTLGLVGREVVREAGRSITGQDPAGALAVIESLVDKGQDLRRFSAELLGFFRDLLVTKVTPDPAKALDLPAAEVEYLKGVASGLSPEEIIRVMNLLMRLVEDMKFASFQRVTLELALIKASSRPVTSVDDILAGIKGLKDGGAVSFSAPAPRAAAASPGRVSGPKRKMDAADDADHYNHPAAPDKKQAHHADTPASELWERAVRELKGRDENDPILAKMQSVVVLGLKDDAIEVAQGILSFSAEQVKQVEDALGCAAGKAVKLVLSSSSKAKDKKTVGEVKKEKETSRKDQIKEEVMQDPLIRSAVDLFGGEIVDIETQEPGLF